MILLYEMTVCTIFLKANLSGNVFKKENQRSKTPATMEMVDMNGEEDKNIGIIQSKNGTQAMRITTQGICSTEVMKEKIRTNAMETMYRGIPIKTY